MIKYSCPKDVWESDKAFGDKMHNVALPHYHHVFGKLNIGTTDGDELDRRFAIDCIGEDKKKIKLYLQEKSLRYDKIQFNAVTIEYMSNVPHKIKGAFFTLNIDYYVFGYATEDEIMFEHLWIFKWNQFKSWLQNQFSEEGLKKFLRYNYVHSRGSFLAIPIDWIPSDIIKYEYHKGNTLFGF